MKQLNYQCAFLKQLISNMNRFLAKKLKVLGSKRFKCFQRKSLNDTLINVTLNINWTIFSSFI